MNHRALITAVVIAFAANAQPLGGQQADAPTLQSPEAAAYIDSALVILESLAIERDTVDWAGFRDSVYVWAMPGADLTDVHVGLLRGLRWLNPHSYLRPTREAVMAMLQRQHARAGAQPARPATPAAARTVDSPFDRRASPAGELHEVGGRRIGHIGIPAFGAAHSTAFADSIQAFVREFAAAGACGWIVDVRGNGGGNMYPMLAGLAPLVGGDTVGWFHETGSEPMPWFVREGEAGVIDQGERKPLASISATPQRLDGVPPVAVLFDRGTASSGEAVAISFVGRANARSFGAHTYGFTTSNQTFPMPDGATLVVTTGVEADRTGRLYPEGLEPDEAVSIVPAGEPIPAAPPTADPQVDAALAWLVAQPGCVE